MFCVRKSMLRSCLAAIASGLLVTASALAGSVTGNPAADGWTGFGNSLANGVYTRGSANYGYNAYAAAMTVTAGSNLEIADGTNSWVAGDTVIGVGGVFQGITAGAAGWGAFSGGAVNNLLAPAQNLKLQAKFGTANSNFSASGIAPGAGDGLGALNLNGGQGSVQIRTTGSRTGSSYASGDGVVNLLASSSHIERYANSTPDSDVARLIWDYDPTFNYVTSWQILLNTSLLARLQPSPTGLTPGPGNLALLTIQNGDGAYTDAVVRIPQAASVVPVPAAAWMGLALMSSLGGAKGLQRLRSRRNA